MQLETIILKSGTASFYPTALTGRPLLELADFFPENSHLEQSIHTWAKMPGNFARVASLVLAGAKLIGADDFICAVLKGN